MNLYEAIRWGNDGDDPLTGGPNGPDTCLIVRAETPEQASILADAELAALRAGWTSALYLLGQDLGSDSTPRVLRGPYIQSAYCHGWRQWQRQSRTDPWTEQVK
ncbi:hypothetical protein [Massilia glaciei]|uniref:Uncharacterized protein n=1 Tax=Massilia glaciei TaxID=1524097 RepID=A0A2U2I5R4_9BURK|nr:hypothetical protein [Massilia glaciei]PWF55100.1 hypothetical protein C7C56_003545 [Massilia glaciei]